MATGREEISSLMGEEVQTLKKAVGSGGVTTEVRRWAMSAVLGLRLGIFG